MRNSLSAIFLFLTLLLMPLSVRGICLQNVVIQCNGSLLRVSSSKVDAFFGEDVRTISDAIWGIYDRDGYQGLLGYYNQAIGALSLPDDVPDAMLKCKFIILCSLKMLAVSPGVREEAHFTHIQMAFKNLGIHDTEDQKEILRRSIQYLQ